MNNFMFHPVCEFASRLTDVSMRTGSKEEEFTPPPKILQLNICVGGGAVYHNRL